MYGGITNSPTRDLHDLSRVYTSKSSTSNIIASWLFKPPQNSIVINSSMSKSSGRKLAVKDTEDPVSWTVCVGSEDRFSSADASVTAL